MYESGKKMNCETKAQNAKGFVRKAFTYRLHASTTNTNANHAASTQRTAESARTINLHVVVGTHLGVIDAFLGNNSDRTVAVWRT